MQKKKSLVYVMLLSVDMTCIKLAQLCMQSLAWVYSQICVLKNLYHISNALSLSPRIVKQDFIQSISDAALSKQDPSVKPH